MIFAKGKCAIDLDKLVFACIESNFIKLYLAEEEKPLWVNFSTYNADGFINKSATEDKLQEFWNELMHTWKESKGQK